jgi:uncharacterized surface protein with fasciclin (FAS1) repeats
MRFRIFALAGLLAALVLSLPLLAQRDATPTIADIIASDDNYETLRRLLERAPELTAMLDNPNSEFTFYAPTEAAYNRLFSDSMLTVEWFLRHPAEIDIMLRQQIVPVAFDVEALSWMHCNALGTMLADNWLLFSENNDGAWQINQEVTNTEAQTVANGLLIPVNHLFPRLRLIPAAGDHSPDGSGSTPSDPRLNGTADLLPADGDVRKVLEADGRFSHWLALLDARPDIEVRLESQGLYTLFIPTDDAFDAYLTDAELDLEAFAVAHPQFTDDSVAPGYYTPALLPDDANFNAPRYCTLQPDGSIVTDLVDGVVTVDGVPLTGEPLVADNAVIYPTDGVRFTDNLG